MREGNPAEENSKEKSAANRLLPRFRARRNDWSCLHACLGAQKGLSTIRDRCSRLRSCYCATMIALLLHTVR